MLKETPAISYFRNFIFGVEDSLVSTVGLLSGIAIAGSSRNTIFLTGAVLIFVEAFSMAAGSFLSETSAEQYADPGGATAGHSVFSSIIMFFSYFISGFIPLSPYLMFSGTAAFSFSIGASLLALFGLGFAGGKISRINPIKNGFKMLLIGGAAILIGVAVGKLVS